jgi:hypothetical protein
MLSRTIQLSTIAFSMLTAACATTSANSPASASLRSTQQLPTGFPATCEPNEVQVMLLGTFHFEGSSRDAISGKPMDMLVPERQAELEDLASRLAQWAPQQVAIEWPASFADSTDARYRRYVERNGATTSSNEVLQVGFRLAKRLGHPTVYPIDHQLMLGNDSIGPLLGRREDLRRREDSVTAALRSAADAAEKANANRTIVQRLFATNTDEALHGGNSRGMFEYLIVGEGQNRGGPQLLARWYERNFYMAHNLTRVLKPDTRRVLVLVGSGHVPALRNIFDESPSFCPVSPLPYLK